MSHAHFFGAIRCPFGLIVGTDDEVKADRYNSDASAAGAIAKSSTWQMHVYICIATQINSQRYKDISNAHILVVNFDSIY